MRELEIVELQTLNPNPVLQLGLEHYNLMAYILPLIYVVTGILVCHELIRFTLDASSPAK
jgi:hypothetical protein